MKSEKIIQCVERTIQGDTKAFEELYTATNQRVYFICLQFLKNEQDANDAVQDTYLSAYKNIRQLSEPSKFLSWVERIAVNVCKQMAKKILLFLLMTKYYLKLLRQMMNWLYPKNT